MAFSLHANLEHRSGREVLFLGDVSSGRWHALFRHARRSLTVTSRWLLSQRVRIRANGGVVRRTTMHHRSSRVVCKVATHVTDSTDSVDVPLARCGIWARQLSVEIDGVRIELLGPVIDAMRCVTDRTGNAHIQNVRAMVLKDHIFRTDCRAIA